MKWNLTKEKRRGLLFLPLVVFPFCCLVFHVLGGGRAPVKGKILMGLNTQLPAVSVDLQKAFQDKLKAYEQADKDSVRRGQYQRQDPYHTDSAGGAVPMAKPVIDLRADQLERRLAGLRKSLNQPAAVIRPVTAVAVKEEAGIRSPAPDPQLDRLNAMLDKVIRIQHPQESLAAVPGVVPASVHSVEEVVAADSSANSIAAIVPEDQTLVAGGTIALRIMDSIRAGGRLVPAGEMVYGTVSLTGDRLLVHIGGFRKDRSLYAAHWQVVDLDGLAGIHIPGLLSREVAKQSADQGVSSLNVLTLDPSLGAQAAGAGIQAAKSFFGRKVREVRVKVNAGYQVLLRSVGATEMRHSKVAPAEEQRDSVAELPDWLPGGTVLESCRNEGMELRLRQICIRDSCLWFGLEWKNRSSIGYSPAYARWTIRDRRVFRRTALQERGMEPCVVATLPVVGGDSVEHSFTGSRPFALPKDKELVLEVGEKGGGRTLVLTISHKTILKARCDAKASQ